jgi:hypothetical protein
MKFKAGGKVKRYDEGGVTEGENSNIDDDTRARALKWAQSGGDGEMEETPVAKTSRPAPRASVKAAPAPAKRMTAEESMSQLDRQTGVKPMNPNSDRGPNAVTGTDFSRNVKNTMNALTPMGGGVGKIGAELAMGNRAAKAAPIAEKGREAVTNPTAWMAGPKGMKAIQKTEDAARRVRKQLPDSATNGGAIGYKKGGTVSSASSRGDGIAIRGKTKGTMAKMCGGGMAKAKK